MRRFFITIDLVLFYSLIITPQYAQEYDSRITKNDLKITLLSLGSGSCRLTYERAFHPRYAAELTAGRIGWGWDFLHKSASKGWLVKAAFKWNVIPQKNSNSWLAGFYLKPELVGTFFEYHPSHSSDADIRKRTSQWALLAETGYQVVYKWFLFDVYAGLGPSIGTGNDNNYFHSFMLFPKESHLAFTAGFRIGVAF